MFKYIKRIQLHCILMALILILMVPFLTGFDIIRHITVQYDGQQKVLRTNSEEPEQILLEAGVKLERGDGWKLLGPNRNVQEGSVIQVLRGQSFSLTRNGETKEYKSSKETVGEALRQLGISFRKQRVYPSVDTPLQKGMQVYVLGKNEELHFSEDSVQPPVRYIEDHSMEYGQQQVASKGKEGTAKVISKRIKNDDGSYSLSELGRQVVVEPETMVVRKGMAMSVLTPDGYRKYKKRIVMESTAYVATGNPTSVGIMPYEGIVAVDPRVIPYYTKMYIPGYGFAMAGDTGGAIVGNIIDLFMDDYHQAIRWGRRNVEVYILEE